MSERELGSLEADAACNNNPSLLQSLCALKEMTKAKQHQQPATKWPQQTTQPPHLIPLPLASNSIMHHATPLIQANSMAAIKTIGKLVSRKVADRLLEKTKHHPSDPTDSWRAEAQDRHADQLGASEEQRQQHLSTGDSNDRGTQELTFVRICELMFARMDPLDKGFVAFGTLKLHLGYHFPSLRIDDQRFRHFEQTLNPRDSENAGAVASSGATAVQHITFSMFVQACRILFGARQLVDQMRHLLVDADQSKGSCSTRVKVLGGKSLSTPTLPSFDQLCRKHDEASQFFKAPAKPAARSRLEQQWQSPEQTATPKSSQRFTPHRLGEPQVERADSSGSLASSSCGFQSQEAQDHSQFRMNLCRQRTMTEKHVLKAQDLIRLARQTRKQQKTRLLQALPHHMGDDDTISSTPRASPTHILSSWNMEERAASETPSETSESLSPTGGSSTRPHRRASMPAHERLHQEKLARHLLNFCANRALAPSNRKPHAAEAARKRREDNQLIRSKRVRNEATSKAFAASVAMISRHVQNEELRETRESQLDDRLTAVDDRKRYDDFCREHYAAIQKNIVEQQARELHQMKQLTTHELVSKAQADQIRQEMLRNSHPTFHLTASSSMLIQEPPELVAAFATVKSRKRHRALKQLEREFFDQVRTHQLRDFVKELRRRQSHRAFPPADTSLIEMEACEMLPKESLDIEGREADERFEMQMMLDALYQECLDGRQDMNFFVPPSNSPPAAQRFYGASNPVTLPPFSTV